MRMRSRTLHKPQFGRQRLFARFLAVARNDNANKSNQVLVTLTLSAKRFNFAAFTPG